MAEESTKTTTRYRRAGGASRREFVQFQTTVPEAVKEHYREQAKRRGVSLSLYLEELAAVDPLATPADDEEASQKTA